MTSVDLVAGRGDAKALVDGKSAAALC